GVDGLFQLQDLTLDVHRDLAAQVTTSHGGGDLGDVAHLRREVRGHGVDGVSEVLPGAGHTGHYCLATQAALGADLAGHPRHLRGERTQLVHHRVDSFLELKDLATDIDGDLLREVAVGHGNGHVGYVPHLGREIDGHLVYFLGEVLPHA